ncbi:oxidoreductase [Nocardioides sp. Root190]|uniref:NADPH-dependent F420 reductase n=1 Tax=Nocardioides sp. Root190 TaxID=1736488 RepID=UPI0006F7E2C0|nr:NADPH-dependent F420 reductase [Nocardioides sp. Root190]KRB80498.1 oxidoreductase [Nocardioides sp. Root190]
MGPNPSETTVAVLGGTGPQGRGLARRFAAGGVDVILGSRDAARAEATAKELRADGLRVVGVDNRSAAAAAGIVVVAVPWDGHGALLTSLRDELSGKVVIDCVNPLGFDKRGPYALPVLEGSATEQAAAILPGSRVVGAFHHLSATLLEDPAVTSLDTDVLVVGDDVEAVDVAVALAAVLPGVRGIFGGRLRNAHQVEALTANLIAINKRYRAHAGLRVTDV